MAKNAVENNVFSRLELVATNIAESASLRKLADVFGVDVLRAYASSLGKVTLIDYGSPKAWGVEDFDSKVARFIGSWNMEITPTKRYRIGANRSR